VFVEREIERPHEAAPVPSVGIRVFRYASQFVCRQSCAAGAPPFRVTRIEWISQ
jgi:hypothetical protein